MLIKEKLRSGKVQYRDVLSEQDIRKQLEQAGISLKVELQKETESTNTLLRKYAQEGEKEDMLLLAEHQTGGRGRKGRNFYSPEGTGLYMSLLLHPQVPAGETAMLTPLAAAAAAGAVEEISGKQAQIKWVNDILIDGKKTVGILTETSGTLTAGCFDYVIVGIGINVYEPEQGFPEEIGNVAGAVFSASDILERKTKREIKQETKQEIKPKIESEIKQAGEESACRAYDSVRCRLAVEVVRRFMEFYRVFPKREYLEEYRQRSALIGKEVKVIPTGLITGSVEKTERELEKRAEQTRAKRAQAEHTAAEPKQPKQEKIYQVEAEQIRYAKVIGIDEQCRLQVRYEDGREEFLSSGEVSVRGR